LTVQQRLVAYRALVRAGSEQGVGLERRGDLARTLLGRLPALLVLLVTAMGDFLVADQQVDGAFVDIDQDLVTFTHQADGAAGSRFRGSVADGQPGSTAGETTIGEQRTGFAQAFGFQVRGWVEHFLHARAAFRTFVANDDDVAFLHFVGEDAAYRTVLAFIDFRGAFEDVDRLIHTGGLHHAAIHGDIAVKHGQAAFLGIGMLDTADAAFGAIQVQARPAGALAEGGLGRDTGRAGL